MIRTLESWHKSKYKSIFLLVLCIKVEVRLEGSTSTLVFRQYTNIAVVCSDIDGGNDEKCEKNLKQNPFGRPHL